MIGRYKMRGSNDLLVKLAAGYANLVDQVIVPCESVQEILLKRGVKTPLEVVPTGIDLKRFSEGDGKAFRRSRNMPSDALVIGHAGRLAAESNNSYESAGILPGWNVLSDSLQIAWHRRRTDQ